jgi:hypothetical protein
MPKSSTLIDGRPSDRRTQNRFAGLRVSDRDARLQDEVHGLRDGQHAVLRQDAGEIAALEVLHDHVGSAVLETPDVEHPRDVLTLDPDGGFRLTLEARHGRPVGEHSGQQKLQRDLLVEVHVPSRNDNAHAPHPEHLLDPVLARKDLPLRHPRVCFQSLLHF